ncbi:hypothetical protein BGZ93_006803 [Podila epicladia]|nr:hypothetical protein BGZ92_009681 [Podila epicladia]KAG0094754.1 hypothetical protein BGZ93_006803 [Podila epicladia]
MWQWKWTADTKLFAILTEKPSPLIDPLPISNTLYTILFVCLSNSLYALLIAPRPRSTFGKQLIATPLTLALLLLPLVTRPPSVVVHQSQGSGAIAFGMRMFDLYFLRPRREAKKTTTRTALKKKNDSELSNEIAAHEEKRSPLMWTMTQLRAELWAPIRRVPSTHIPPYDSNKSGLIPVTALIKQVVCYIIISDVTIFIVSRFSLADLRNLSTVQYGLFMCLFGFIHFSVLLLVNIVAIVWSLATGESVDPEEWTMITKPLPYLAVTPSEFWGLWHTMFRAIWVDLGFLPVQRFAKEHLGPDRVGTGLAKAARLALPVMAVFCLSGLLHGYVVFAVWRESPWSQVMYFLLQGVAVVISKAIEQSPFGSMITQKYVHGSTAQRAVLRAVGIVLVWCLHIATAPFFLHAFLENEVWLSVVKGSVLWRLFG